MYSEEVDKLVDEWSLHQIDLGNTDPRFLNANRAQRKEMMSNGMFDETDDERIVRHPSEEFEIYIIESGDENSPWVPLLRVQGGADDEGSSSSSAASAARARAPVSNWVSNWVHTVHTVPNVTGRSKRARARAKAKAKARRKNVSVTCGDLSACH